MVLAAAQPSTSAEPGTTNTSPSLNPKPTGSVPTPTSTGAQIETTSGEQVPTTKVTITEQTLGVKQPTTAPLSTKPDTWTPAGLTGAGKPWQPITGNVNLPDLPYDTNKSKMTIGEQIFKQQQQQQAPVVEYDMFGFPIDNTADPLDPFAGLFDFAAPTPAPTDPFSGSFGGAVSGQNQAQSSTLDIFGGSNQGLFGDAAPNQGLFGDASPTQGLFGGSGRGGGQGPLGNMMQTMMLMRMLGGGDAPDPPSTPARGGGGRGGRRGRGPLSQMTPFERALLLEERRIIRENKINQARMHNQFQGNQGWQQGPQNPGLWNQGPWNQRPQGPNGWNNIPRPQQSSSRRAREVMSRRSQNSNVRYEYPAAAANNINSPPINKQSFHPSVLDRNNMVTEKPTLKPGQEPVEREAGNARQRRNKFSSAEGSSSPARRFTSPPIRSTTPTKSLRKSLVDSVTQPSYSSPSLPQTTVPIIPPNPVSLTPSSMATINNNRGWNVPFNTGNNFAQGQGRTMLPPRRTMTGPQRGMNNIPRNLQQLMASPQFQRNMRTSGSFPGANTADVQADRADLMADRMDNMQSISPLQRLLNAQMGGGAFGGLMGGSPFGGMRPSPLAGLGSSPLAGLAARRQVGIAARRQRVSQRRPTPLDSVLSNLFGSSV